MSRFLLLVLHAVFAVSSPARAVVIRDDLDDSKYLVPAAEFAALVDLPGEGHGVLVAPRWVVTAAHAVSWQPGIKSVVINGISRDVAHLVMHAGYKQLPEKLIHQALGTGDATLVRALLASSDDIALLKLTQPVTDIAPAALYARDDELSQIVKIVGKGATGTGAVGYGAHDSHRTELRRAFNKISSAHERWFCYVFDAAPSALPFEGMTGNGDSGGPALIQGDDQWLLAGLASWTAADGDVRTSRQGRYGQISCSVRISHYVDWIESNVSSRPEGGS